MGTAALASVVAAAAVLWRLRSAVSEALWPHWQQYGRLATRQWELQAAFLLSVIFLLASLLTIWQVRIRRLKGPNRFRARLWVHIPGGVGTWA